MLPLPVYYIGNGRFRGHRISPCYTMYSMDVDFYFDPACPFCWITSRWLLMVSGQRDVTITWRPFSLAIKNDALDPAKPDKTGHGDLHRGSHRVLRVMRAAEARGAALIDLYTDFGIAHHIAGDAFDDDLIAKILAKHKLPAELAAAADDTSYDKDLTASIKTAVDVAGEDIGVPTIVFTTADGRRNGFFGPVLQTLPDMDAALRLWDGLSLLATDDNFYELKRSRPDGDPDVYSTAKC